MSKACEAEMTGNVRSTAKLTNVIFCFFVGRILHVTPNGLMPNGAMHLNKRVLSVSNPYLSSRLMNVHLQQN